MQAPEKNVNTYVAIMAGGIGSRFWPLSRVNFPKQFLDILGTGKTLIQVYRAYKRFQRIAKDMAAAQPPIILVVLHQLIETHPQCNIVQRFPAHDAGAHFGKISFRL